ncbi:MAG TPA: DegT/DnrJ/EryC1/StrS family aminotransferase [Candidatus Hydrogenedentes bacterium]|nr:DegT/DnrJ/EryC1/StrS family aminotransferase [Candidatus Hydrogenedentota bacterium]HQH53374.1 DegT/DnrJ/EryC1/StrS family aminotransferase [Candidatus Hydrogenedentota bacterium]
MDTEKTKSELALYGGPLAVTLAGHDRWQRIPVEAAKRRIGELLDEEIITIANGGGVIGEFERAFREMIGTKFALCMNSGTATLHSAYVAAGVKPGTEVLLPSYTWHATVTPVLHCSAMPVFCDIEPDTLVIDPADVERKVTRRTRAICVVHTWGNVVDMDPIMAIAETHGLTVIEDASHAHGASYKGRPVGGIGHIGCFSLQGQKAVTGGEAGVAVTNDPELLDRMILLGHFGRITNGEGKRTFDHLGDMGLGTKYRAHPFAIALALETLEMLPELNEGRTRCYAILNNALRDIEGIEVIDPREGTKRGGYLEFKFKVARNIAKRLNMDRLEEAFQAEGAPITRDRYSTTNFTYGLIHRSPLFTSFDRRTLGGCFYDPVSYQGPPVAPPSLPVTEDVCTRLFGCYAFVDVAEEFLLQMAEAMRKVMTSLDQLS